MVPPEAAETNYYLNYVHYGNTLEVLPAIVSSVRPMKRLDKGELLDRVVSSRTCRTRRELVAVADVIKYFRGSETTQIDLDALESAVTHSRWWREVFHSLRCRGFSFRLSSSPQLKVYRVREDVNLRIGLLLDERLYYPPAVRHDIREERTVGRFSHLSSAIGWVLGREERLGEDKCWFLLNVQSDLMKTTCASLKDIFRGWQRVLVGLIIGVAKLQRVSRIALVRAEDVILTTRFYKGLRNVPNCWENLYNRTGEAFGMCPVNVGKSVDVQVVLNWSPVLTSEFLVLDTKQIMDQVLAEGIRRLEPFSNDLSPSRHALSSLALDFPSL